MTRHGSLGLCSKAYKKPAHASVIYVTQPTIWACYAAVSRWMEVGIGKSALMMLKSSSLFGGLPKRALLQLISLGKSSTTHAGQSLYHQGEAGTTLFLIISGEIRISASSSDGKVLHLNTLATGDVMGEIALLDGGLYLARHEVL